MNAGRELDALVAEKVMEQSVTWFGLGEDKSLMFSDTIDRNEERRRRGEMLWGYPGGGDVPEYSTNMTAAWEVVDRMRADAWFVDLEDSSSLTYGPWWCQFARSRYTAKGESTGQTAPHAICLAALKALGVEVEE